MVLSIALVCPADVEQGISSAWRADGGGCQSANPGLGLKPCQSCNAGTYTYIKDTDTISGNTRSIARIKVPPGGVRSWAAVAVGSRHTCAIAAETDNKARSLYCWGEFLLLFAAQLGGRGSVARRIAGG